MTREPGKVEIHWDATEAFTTGQVPVIHGGALATLLDNVMGWATYSRLPVSSFRDRHLWSRGSSLAAFPRSMACRSLELKPYAVSPLT